MSSSPHPGYYLSAGHRQLERRGYLAALRFFHAAWGYAAQRGEPFLQGAALIQMGETFRLLGDTSTAMILAREAEKSMSEVESRAGMALVAELLARLHKDDGQTGKAWAFFKRARNQHGKLHDEPSVGQATRDMEQVKTLDSDRSGRSNRLKNAVLARRIKARLDIAEARQTIGYRDEARDMLCECLAMARDDDFKNLGPFILTDLGAALTDIGMAEEGGDVLSVAAGTAKARGRGPYVLAQIAAKQGKAALQSDQVKEANVHYARATGLYRDARRPELAGTMLMEIARIHAASECYDLADRAANGALILFLEAGEIDRAVMTYGEMADFARTDDRLFDALAYTNKATALEHVAFPPPKPDGP